MTEQKKEKRVLYIENDEKLVVSFSELLSIEMQRTRKYNVKIGLEVARHIDDARDKLIVKGEKFDGLIVDLMLPRNANELAELTRLEDLRRNTLAKLIKMTNYDVDQLDNETARLRGEIDRIDESIESCLAMQGGCEILEDLADKLSGSEAKGKRRALELPVIFWTARGAKEVKERCRKVVHPDYFKWFEKPSDEESILQELIKLLEEKEDG